MLTVRIHYDDIYCAFQTNRMVSLIHRGCVEFDAIMMHIPAGAKPGVFDITASEFRGFDYRQHQQHQPVAVLKIDAYRNEPGDGAGDKTYAATTRIICFYEGDTAHVLDCGTTLFEFPRK
jgi:hypothetical protein